MVSTEQTEEVRQDRAASWESRLWRLFARRGVSTALSIGLVVAAICLGSFTYMLLTGLTPFSPTRPVVISLLVVNLAVVLVLFALIFWRVIRIILARVSGTAGAKLHARLVTLFAIVAVMPAIIVAVFAAVTLNRGLDTWFGERAQIIISNAETVAEAYLNEHRQVLRGDTLAMATDINRESALLESDPNFFFTLFNGQTRVRSLHAAYLIKSDGRILVKARGSVEVGMPAAEHFEAAKKDDIALFVVEDHNQIRALVALPDLEDTYLYVARFVDAQVLEHLAETRATVDEYESLESRRSQFQITFALIYVTVALITLIAAIWLGLWAANRIVDPISQLVRAAERVSVGDLRARVPVGGTGDELDMLTGAFNRMTSQLESQRSDLIEANHQLDERRQFTEAVLSGVSAGVLGLDNEGLITHANRAALPLLPALGGEAPESRDRDRHSPDGLGRRRCAGASRPHRAGAGRHRAGRTGAHAEPACNARADGFGAGRFRAHLRRHNRARAGAANLRMGGHRAPHRARNQESADTDPAFR